MAPPMVKVAVNAKVNFSMLYLISEMVVGSHIKLYQVCCGQAIRAQSFVFPFIFPLNCVEEVGLWQDTDSSLCSDVCTANNLGSSQRFVTMSSLPQCNQAWHLCKQSHMTALTVADKNVLSVYIITVYGTSVTWPPAPKETLPNPWMHCTI